MVKKSYTFKIKADTVAAQKAVDKLSAQISDSIAQAALDGFKRASAGIGSSNPSSKYSRTSGYSGYVRAKNAAGEGSFHQQQRTTTNPNTGKTEVRNTSYNQQLNDVKKNLAALNSALTRQTRAASTGIKQGHITYEANSQLNADRKSLASGGTWANVGESYKADLRRLTGARTGLDANLRTAKMGGNEDQIHGYEQQIQQNEELSTAYRKFIESMDKATEGMKTMDESLKSNSVTVDVKRGSWQDSVQTHAFMTGSHIAASTTSSITGMYHNGMNYNQADGQQAIQLGSMVGGRTDSQIREDVQSYVPQYGYDTQSGLDFYTQSMRSSRGQTMTAGEAKKRVGTMEQAGRASGLGEGTYSNLTTVLGGSGALSKDSDIKNVVQTVLAANALSGDSGNKEQNAQTLTTLISQISATRGVSAKGAENVAVTQSAFSKLGSAWQGDAGATNVQNMNNAFTSASHGSNQAAIYSIMRSQGLTGLTGYTQAQVQAEKGLSDKRNVQSMINQYTGMARSGATGNALVQQNLKSTYNLGATAAKEVATGLKNGTLDVDQIQKIANKDKKGDYDKGSKEYKNSEQSVLNQRSSQLEKNASKMSTALKGVTSTLNKFNSTLLGSIATTVGTSIASYGASNVVGSLASGASKKLFGTKAAGEAVEETAGAIGNGGFMNTVKGLFSKGGSGIKGLFSKGSKIAEAGSLGDDAIKAAGAGESILSRLGKSGSAIKAVAKSPLMKGLGKVAGPISAVASVIDIATSKNKAKAIGSNAGGFAGAAGGAQLGAGIGTAIFPGAGTVIGAGIGAITGGIGGSLGGGWLGDHAKGIWNGTKKVAGNAWNWTKGATGNVWNWVTGKDSKKSKDGSTSKKGAEKSQDQINNKETERNLTAWKKIMDDWKKNNRDLAKANNDSSKSTSTTHHAFGGIVSGQTTIAEGNKPEWVVPLDPAKQSYTKNALSQITQMTGIRATDDKPQVVQSAGSFSPSITVNNSGSTSASDSDALVHRITQALNNATSDYRFNMRRS